MNLDPYALLIVGATLVVDEHGSWAKGEGENLEGALLARALHRQLTDVPGESTPSTEGHGYNLAWTVLHVPYSLDSSTGLRFTTCLPRLCNLRVVNIRPTLISEYIELE
jgi:hypothetical protein